MTFEDMTARARDIRALYKPREQEASGQSWSREDIMMGFVGDVGDLAKLVMAKQGHRTADTVDAKLAHELSDCLWSILVPADEYDIDLKTSFLGTMDDIEGRLA